jgi:hypothetical protein
VLAVPGGFAARVAAGGGRARLAVDVRTWTFGLLALSNDNDTAQVADACTPPSILPV